ncbi:MAG: hypothetical protein OXG35_00300 [Acidobacteria bacterium]|nr:hypothetical protein [Acidobacteriota bacterium]
MDDRLRQAAGAAVERGIDFLEEVVASNGGWPCWRYDDTALVGDRHLEYPPFAAALGLLALDACDHPGTRALVARTREFIRSFMQYPGIWSYPGLPPSVDDTAICALAAGPHPWLRMGRLLGLNLDVMLSHRDGDGRFLLWMPGDDWPPGLDNEVDAVVNANVLAYMGDHAETRAARRWLETVVADRREAEASPYYIEPVDLHFALARAGRFRDGIFSGLRPTLASRILERLDDDGGFGDPMRTAQALSALDMIVFDLDAAMLAAIVRSLVEAQRRDGSWRPCLAWKEPPGWAVWVAANEGPRHVRPPRGFASEAMTTAFCIEALQRSLRSSGSAAAGAQSPSSSRAQKSRNTASRAR